MNYEKVILEMLERIKDLEEKVDILEEFKRDLESGGQEPETPPGAGEEKNTESGRVRARQEVMHILKEKYDCSTRKGNRSEGSGVVATKNGKSYGVKVSYSKSYFDLTRGNYLCCGWHAMIKKEFDADFAYYIFVVAGENDELYYFMFTRDDLYNTYFTDRDPDNKKVHFYFRVDPNGRPHEDRDGETDMTAHYNNWDIFKF